jgi:hypothetical protein
MGGPVTEGTDGVVDVHFKLGQAGEPSIVTVSVHKTVATKLFFAAKYVRN